LTPARPAEEDQQAAAAYDAVQAPPQAPPPAPPAAPATDPIAELERLTRLHESGALTDQEFTAAKARASACDRPRPEEVPMTDTAARIEVLQDALRAAATHSGPLVLDELEPVPTGRRIELRGVFIAEFEGDRIRAFRQYWDEAELLDGLGLLPGD
jgi:hypothetical protein